MSKGEKYMATFILNKEWIDIIQILSVDLQDKVISEIVRYKAGLESQHEDDVIVQALVNFIKAEYL